MGPRPAILGEGECKKGRSTELYSTLLAAAGVLREDYIGLNTEIAWDYVRRRRAHTAAGPAATAATTAAADTAGVNIHNNIITLLISYYYCVVMRNSWHSDRASHQPHFRRAYRLLPRAVYTRTPTRFANSPLPPPLRFPMDVIPPFGVGKTFFKKKNSIDNNEMLL